MTYEEIEQALIGREKLKVRFYDGLFIFIIRALKEQRKFVGKYLPCRANAREYSISPKDIAEIVKEN